MITLAFLFLVCLYYSAFFSGSEMAYISANKLKLRELADAGDLQARQAVRLQEQPQYFLTSILIGNNIVNVAATAILTYAFETYFGIANEWVVAGVMTPLLLVFGEMLPKDYGRLRSQTVLIKYADNLSLFVKALHYPCVWILKIINWVLAPLGPMHRSIFVSEAEFRSLIEESAKTGVLEQHEKKIVDTILDFERIRLDSVMQPLEKTPKVDITSNVGEVKKLAAQTKSHIVLVYDESPSFIVGMIYVFDVLFEENAEAPLKTYLRSPIFLSGETSIETAFLTLQQKRQSYAVVTDTRGDGIGLAPIEKLLVI